MKEDIEVKEEGTEEVKENSEVESKEDSKVESKQESKEEPKQEPKTKREIELIGTLQRVQAEFENYKKRIDKQSEEFRKYASEGIIKDILPVLDNFELALQKIDTSGDFVKGIELIYSQLIDILHKRGLEKLREQIGHYMPGSTSVNEKNSIDEWL